PCRESRPTEASLFTVTAPPRPATFTSPCATSWATRGCGSTSARGPSGRSGRSCRSKRGSSPLPRLPHRYPASELPRTPDLAAFHYPLDRVEIVDVRQWVLAQQHEVGI